MQMTQKKEEKKKKEKKMAFSIFHFWTHVEDGVGLGADIPWEGELACVTVDGEETRDPLIHNAVPHCAVGTLQINI